MMYEQWAAGRNPDYRPTLVDLWQLAAERTAERDRTL